MTALINGKFVPPEQAVVSVIDRSFRYGDGVFETIPVYNGKPFRWAQHLERLTRGADFLKIRLPFAPKELRALGGELVQRNQMPDSCSASRCHVARVNAGIHPKMPTPRWW